jgi:hypothetical protein
MGVARSMVQLATWLRALALAIWFGGGLAMLVATRAIFSVAESRRHNDRSLRGGGPRGRVGAAHHNFVLVAKPDGIFARNVMRLRQSFGRNANCRRGAHARGDATSTLYHEEEVSK